MTQSVGGRQERGRNKKKSGKDYGREPESLCTMPVLNDVPAISKPICTCSVVLTDCQILTGDSPQVDHVTLIVCFCVSDSRLVELFIFISGNHFKISFNLMRNVKMQLLTL